MNQMAPSRSVDLDKVIATISEAAGDPSKWLLVAFLVSEVRKAGSWRGTYASDADWLNAAAQAYGKTPNTIRRLLAAAEFLESKIDKKKSKRATSETEGKPPAISRVFDPIAGSGNFTMASVEVIKRMHDIAPEQADAALGRLGEGDLSYRQAKEQYDKLIESKAGTFDAIFANPPFTSFNELQGRKLSSRRAHEQRNRLGSIIQSHLETLSSIDAKSAKIGRIKFDYVSPDNVVVGRHETGALFVDGYDYKKLAHGTPKADLLKLVSDTAFSSTFFRRYWLILDAAHNEIDILTASLKDLGLNNVGIALYEAQEQDDLSLIRAPSGRPIPDRQENALRRVAF